MYSYEVANKSFICSLLILSVPFLISCTNKSYLRDNQLREEIIRIAIQEADSYFNYTRAKAYLILGLTHDLRFMPLLKKACLEEYGEALEAAAKALCELGPEGKATLKKLKEEKDSDGDPVLDEFRIVDELYMADPEYTRKMLKEQLHDDEYASGQLYAAQKLAEMGGDSDASMVEVLKKEIRRPVGSDGGRRDEDYQRLERLITAQALMKLLSMKSYLQDAELKQEIIKIAIEETKSKDSYLRTKAYIILGRTHSVSFVPLLKKACLDEQYDKAEAARALCELGPEGIETFKKLKDEKALVDNLSAEPEVIDVWCSVDLAYTRKILKRGLYEGNEANQIYAAQKLAQMGDASGVEILKETIKKSIKPDDGVGSKEYERIKSAKALMELLSK